MIKKTFSLLEIVIAFLLATLLVAVIFQGLRHFSTQEKIVSEMKEEALERQRLYLRLKPLFLNLDHFQWDGKGAAFWYSNPVHPQKEFRGTLVSLLHVYQGELFLTTWPQTGQPHHESLMKCKEPIQCLTLDEKTGEWIDLDPERPRPSLIKFIIQGAEFPFSLPPEGEKK